MVSFLQQVEKFLKSPQAVIDFFQCTFHIVIGRVLMESLAQAFWGLIMLPQVYELETPGSVFRSFRMDTN